jgi:hypothetical protein
VLSCGVSSFVPAGAVSETQVDVDPSSLRSLLLPYSTTVKFRLKHCVGELLFHLCDQQGPLTAPLSRPLAIHPSVPFCASSPSGPAVFLRPLQRLSTFACAASEMPSVCWQRRAYQVSCGANRRSADPRGVADHALTCAWCCMLACVCVCVCM